MNFISRIIKSINAMRERLKIERHEAMYGPHFNEECALKAVSKMENEDGSRGKIGDHVHVLEVLGTFKKTTVYSLGSITQVSNPYDEALPQGQFPIPGQNRRKLVDVFISCNGESKKLSVPAERSIINDTSIGLTVATNKEEIANMVRQNYNEFKAKKEAASKYDEEMEKCKDILDQLEAQVEAPIITNTIDNSKEINDLKNDVADIRKMIEDTKKMFMGGFPKPPMPPMPNVPAPMK